MLPPAIATRQKASVIARIIEGFMFLLGISHGKQLRSLAMDCISASVITWFLGATFDFNAGVGGASRIPTACMGSGFIPPPPCPGMNCLVRARNVANAPILAMVMNMRCLAPSVPTARFRVSNKPFGFLILTTLLCSCGRTLLSDASANFLGRLSAPFTVTICTIHRRSGSRYAGFLSRAPPKNWQSAWRISQAITETGVIWIVTSSHAANTGPTLASASAASLRYLR